MAIKVQSAAVSQFPALTDGTPAVLVVLGNQDPTAGPIDFTAITNIGRDLGNTAVVAAIGYVLHTVGHSLLFGEGEVVDLRDLADPAAAAAEGGVS
jgi:hypothetical protein